MHWFGKQISWLRGRLRPQQALIFSSACDAAKSRLLSCLNLATIKGLAKDEQPMGDGMAIEPITSHVVVWSSDLTCIKVPRRDLLGHGGRSHL